MGLWQHESPMDLNEHSKGVWIDRPVSTYQAFWRDEWLARGIMEAGEMDESSSSSKASVVCRLLAVKQKSGKTWSQIAAETGLTNVYVAQLLRRQAHLKPDTAPVLRAALPDLTDDLVAEMMKPPMRSYDPNIIQDPTIYRLNEAIMHFGESIKEIINEEFGDGM